MRNNEIRCLNDKASDKALKGKQKNSCDLSR